MMKGVNFQFTATNKTGPAMQGVQNGLKGVKQQTEAANRANQSFMRGMSDNRRGIQQVGFQVADFSVQIAGGQNAMLAFAQQGGQILQFFGAFGAVAGAALAVASAVYISMSNGAVSSKALGEALDKTKGSFDRYRSYVETATETTAELTAKFGEFAGQIRSFSSFMAGVSLAETFEDLKKTLGPLTGGLREVQIVNQHLIDATEALAKARAAGHKEESDMIQFGIQLLADYTSKMTEVASSYGMSTDQALRFANAVDQIGKENTLKGVADQAGVAFRVLQELSASGFDLPPQLREAAAALEEMSNMAASTKTEIDNSVSAGVRLNNTNMSDGLRDALTVAQQLALATREALFAQKQVGRGGDPRQFVDDKYWKDMYFPDPEKMNFPTPKRTTGGGAKQEDPLVKLQKQLALETQLLGMSDAQRRVVQALGADWKSYGTTVIDGLTAQIAQVEAFNQRVAEQENIADTIKSSMSDAFMSIVDGTMKAKDAFKKMAATIIADLFRILVVQRMVNAVAGFFGLGNPVATVAARGIASFAGGGSTGYGARSGGVDGKGGFPAILHPNETVVDHTAGQGTGGVVVNQTISFGSGVTRAEVQSMIPKIVEATKSAVLDARKRGGTYGGAFA